MNNTFCVCKLFIFYLNKNYGFEVLPIIMLCMKKNVKPIIK